MLELFRGPGLIALAAILWSTDAIFRISAIETLHPGVVVFLEHLIALLLLAPLAFWRHRGELFKLKASSWVYAVIAGAGGSALGTLFFTASFQYLNPSVAILLQKTQPLWVILLAVVFLRERPTRVFYAWAAVALAAVVMLTFSDLQVGAHSSKGVMYALMAAGIWAIATVSGRAFTQAADPVIATFWRYVFGWLTLGAMIALGGESVPWDIVLRSRILESLVYMALFTGLLAMLAYYYGLRRTPATVATFVELIFPVSAVTLNTWLLRAPLQPMQIVAAGVLVFAVFQVSRSGSGRPLKP